MKTPVTYLRNILARQKHPINEALTKAPTVPNKTVRFRHGFTDWATVAKNTLIWARDDGYWHPVIFGSLDTPEAGTVRAYCEDTLFPTRVICRSYHTDDISLTRPEGRGEVRAGYTTGESAEDHTARINAGLYGGEK